MTKITKIEAQALQGILDSDFMDGETGQAAVMKPVWTWSANTFGNKRVYAGAVSSLVKKGLVVVSDMGTEDACIQMTQAGFDALQVYETEQLLAEPGGR